MACLSESATITHCSLRRKAYETAAAAGDPSDPTHHQHITLILCRPHHISSTCSCPTGGCEQTPRALAQGRLDRCLPASNVSGWAGPQHSGYPNLPATEAAEANHPASTHGGLLLGGLGGCLHQQAQLPAAAGAGERLQQLHMWTELCHRPCVCSQQGSWQHGPLQLPVSWSADRQHAHAWCAQVFTPA